MKKEKLLIDLYLENKSMYSKEERLQILRAYQKELIIERRQAYIRSKRCGSCRGLINCSLVFSDQECSQEQLQF